jgi:hypothetical protein
LVHGREQIIKLERLGQIAGGSELLSLLDQAISGTDYKQRGRVRERLLGR